MFDPTRFRQAATSLCHGKTSRRHPVTTACHATPELCHGVTEVRCTITTPRNGVTLLCQKETTLCHAKTMLCHHATMRRHGVTGRCHNATRPCHTESIASATYLATDRHLGRVSSRRNVNNLFLLTPFIPTPSGHPHAGGDIIDAGGLYDSEHGPSPRGWGHQRFERVGLGFGRAIPTRVGTSETAPIRPSVTAGHPHAGGDIEWSG